MHKGFAAPARRAHKIVRERSPVLKGLLRIRRYHQQETPYALQEGELFSWLQFGEAYSALRGWRPIPAALLSHSVLLCSGTEDNSLPTQRLPRIWSRPTQGKSIPDKHRSIGKKLRPVKSFEYRRVENFVQKRTFGPCFARPRLLVPRIYYYGLSRITIYHASRLAESTRSVLRQHLETSSCTLNYPFQHSNLLKYL